LLSQSDTLHNRKAAIQVIVCLHVDQVRCGFTVLRDKDRTLFALQARDYLCGAPLQGGYEFSFHE
jgi:hypothetical protein